MQPRFFQSIRLRESTGKSFAKKQGTIDWQAKLLITSEEELAEHDRLDNASYIVELHSLAQLGSTIARHYLAACSRDQCAYINEKLNYIISRLQELSHQQYYPEVVCALSDIHMKKPFFNSEDADQVFSLRQGIAYLKQVAFDHSPKNVLAAHKLAALYEPDYSPELALATYQVTAANMTHSLRWPNSKSLSTYYLFEFGSMHFPLAVMSVKKFIAELEDYAYAYCEHAIHKLLFIYSGQPYPEINRDEAMLRKWNSHLQNAEKQRNELASEYLLNAIHATLKYGHSLTDNSEQYPLEQLIEMYVTLHKMDEQQVIDFQNKMIAQLVTYAKEGYAHSCMHLSIGYSTGYRKFNILPNLTNAAYWLKQAIKYGVCSDPKADVEIMSQLVISHDSPPPLDAEDDMLQLAYNNGSRLAALHLAKQALSTMSDTQSAFRLANKYILSIANGEFSFQMNELLHEIVALNTITSLSDECRDYSIRWMGLAILKKYTSSAMMVEIVLRDLKGKDLKNKWQCFVGKCSPITYPEIYQQELNELVSETSLAFAKKNEPVKTFRLGM